MTLAPESAVAARWVTMPFKAPVVVALAECRTVQPQHGFGGGHESKVRVFTPPHQVQDTLH